MKPAMADHDESSIRHQHVSSIGRWLPAFLVLAVTIAVWLAPGTAHAGEQVDLPGPSGSGQFGTTVTVLPNGNIVVIDPAYDTPGGATDVGAVYLYDGATGALISMLTGSTTDDQVGSSGVTVLSNGNYVVRSPSWDNGGAANAGAVTWGSDTTGITGTVSTANSLVGSTTDDYAGSDGVTALTNGNYVVRSQNWDNGAATDAGAVTWGNGTTGVTGAVSAANSLVGSAASDQVGSTGVTVLSNGNYVVRSTSWDNGAVNGAGAVTWGNGTTGITGAVSAANSLVGSTAYDQIGSTGVTVLSSGNYVVRSAYWDNGAVANAGAVTWGNGTTGVTSAVSAANSLVGSKTTDQVGNEGVTALSNGNYVVVSAGWDKGTTADVGAVTWGNGTTGVTGAVSVTNSLVGSMAGDYIGSPGVTALSNGNYLVVSKFWKNGAAANAGAVTWGNGAIGVTGAVSVTNSLVGSKADDQVGSEGVTALSNGNYVVRSQYWNNGAAAFAGAVTWGNGTTGVTGAVSVTNSLVGSAAYDNVGVVIALSNGNYVVASRLWDNGAAAAAGAVTWGNGATGVTGTISVTNSLVGSTAYDNVGGEGVTALTNGNYVVCGQGWDNGAATDVGAVTLGDGTTGVTGAVSAANSLVGSTVGDNVGTNCAVALNNGNYVVISPKWDNGAATDAGAVTWGNGTTGVTGAVSTANSLVGGTTNNQVGSGSVVTLTNGNYVVRSLYWDDGAATNVGAVTWGNGTTGVTGAVSAANSLVGSMADDQIGSGSLTAVSSGYVVRSPGWDNGAATDAGAVTWGDGITGVTGVITTANSVRGVAASGGNWMNYVYDPTYAQLIVGRRADNMVTIFKTPSAPAVTLAKTVAPAVHVAYRGIVTYTLRLENGAFNDGSVTVTDTLSPGTAFAGWIEQPAGATFVGNALAWSGPVAQAEVITFTFAVTNTGSAGATITNTAWFSGSQQAGSAAAAYTTSSTLYPSGSGFWDEVYPPCSGVCKYVVPTGVTVTLRGDISLRGDFEIEPGGAFIPNGRTVTLTGDRPQTLTGSPTNFYNLVINKTNKTDTVTIDGKLKVTKKLTITKGKLVSASDYGDVEIGDEGELELTSPITIGGNLIVTGALATNNHAITFDGGVDGNEMVTQALFLSGTTFFGDINVYTNTLLIETNLNDTVLITGGRLTNYGVIRKTQPVSGLERYYFGLAGVYPNSTGMVIDVTDLTGGNPLTALQVERIDRNHPNASGSTATDVYWQITPSGTNYVATLVLPQNALADPLACRYDGVAWDCARTSFDSITDLTVTRAGVTAFSDWAVYETRPDPSEQRHFLPSILAGVSPPRQETLETTDAAESVAPDTGTTAEPALAEGMVLPDGTAVPLFLPLVAR